VKSVLRRKTLQPDKADWTSYRVLEAVSAERLWLIGAVCLEWNYIEDMVDGCVGWATHIELDMRRDVISRINGLDGKFELIKKGARLNPVFSPAHVHAISGTIGAIAEYKKYSDAIIHARLFDPKPDIGGTAPNREETHDILLSEATLKALFHRMEALSDAIVLVWRLLEEFAFIGFLRTVEIAIAM
jgi:hypothetical protein